MPWKSQSGLSMNEHLKYCDYIYKEKKIMLEFSPGNDIVKVSHPWTTIDLIHGVSTIVDKRK